MPEWISVKDSLPIDGQPVIAFIDVTKSENLQQKFIMHFLKQEMKKVVMGYAVIESWEQGEFLSGINKTANPGPRFLHYPNGDDFITHWMPLPKPPEDL
jgi:hypothetical protein